MCQPVMRRPARFSWTFQSRSHRHERPGPSVAVAAAIGAILLLVSRLLPKD